MLKNFSGANHASKNLENPLNTQSSYQTIKRNFRLTRFTDISLGLKRLVLSCEYNSTITKSC